MANSERVARYAHDKKDMAGHLRRHGIDLVEDLGPVGFTDPHTLSAGTRTWSADRIIVETDCPYLAPVPFRGRRNEPAYIPHILGKLAEIRGWTLVEAERRTEDAFFTLFDRLPRP